MVKSTKEDIINKLAELNFYMKDDELYINTNTRMTICCDIHNEEWVSTVGDAYRKAKYCEKCRELDGNWRDIAKSKEYNILNETGKYATFQCKFNHETWTTQKNHIKSTECKVCSGRQITLRQVLDKLKTKKFELLNKEEYKSTKTRGKFKCCHNHEWETEIHNVYGDKSECPICGTNSLESRCKFILETIFNKRFCRTRNVVEGGLELDMYNMELKLACEAQGAQHFIYHPNYFHKNGGFEDQQERDSRKKKWCEENDIKLIIVKYDISTFDAQIEYIILRLKELFKDKLLELTDLNSIDWEEKKEQFLVEFNTYKEEKAVMNTSDEEVDVCMELANSKNGEFLSIIRDKDTGRTHGKFKCKMNHTFSKSLADIRRNRWCLDCAFNAPNTQSGIEEKLNNVNISLKNLYINNSTNLKLKCDVCEFEYEATWDNLKKREVESYKCCRNCNSSNNNIMKINEKLESIGFAFGDVFYKDAKTKHKFVCKNGHVYVANWNSMKVRNGGCKECKPTKNMLKKEKKAESTLSK